MANDYRNESRRRPPLEKYGTPGTQYPTPNPYDVVITEEVTSRAQAFEPVLFGTPHPVVSAAVLCYQSPVKSGNTDKAPVRIYANPRLAQEPYNLVTGADEANDQAYPTFVRSYLLPRGYTPATIGQPLTALIGLALVNGGTGYVPTAGSHKIPLVFTGGAGSGAAGYGEVIGGIIVAVVLTHGGSYTAVPTVSAAGGAGLSVTALLQPASAILVSEQEQPAEEPFGGWFVRVTRTWETIPGKPIISYPEDKDAANFLTVTRTKRKLSDITPAYSHVNGTSATIVTKEPIDGLYGYEVTTVFPNGPHHDSTTAKVSFRNGPKQFPTYIHIEVLDAWGTIFGKRSTFAEQVQYTDREWFVIADDEPPLALDIITPGDIYINDVQYNGVLHDETTRFYGTMVTIPATTPSATEYAGVRDTAHPAAPGTGTKWIGTERIVGGSVIADGHPNRFRVTTTSVVMQ